MLPPPPAVPEPAPPPFTPQEPAPVVPPEQPPATAGAADNERVDEFDAEIALIFSEEATELLEAAERAGEFERP